MMNIDVNPQPLRATTLDDVVARLDAILTELRTTRYTSLIAGGYVTTADLPAEWRVRPQVSAEDLKAVVAQSIKNAERLQGQSGCVSAGISLARDGSPS